MYLICVMDLSCPCIIIGFMVKFYNLMTSEMILVQTSHKTEQICIILDTYIVTPLRHMEESPSTALCTDPVWCVQAGCKTEIKATPVLTNC